MSDVGYVAQALTRHAASSTECQIPVANMTQQAQASKPFVACPGSDASRAADEGGGCVKYPSSVGTGAMSPVAACITSPAPSFKVLTSRPTFSRRSHIEQPERNTTTWEEALRLPEWCYQSQAPH